jgi:response regulator NasT
MNQGKYDYCLGTANQHLKRQLSCKMSTAGFYNSGTAESIPELLRTLRAIQPWLAVVDMRLPPGNIEQLAAIIEGDCLAAAIYLGAPNRRLKSYPQLPWPVEAPVLTAVAEAVCRELIQKKRLKQELDILQQKLSERREIEKAKMSIMQQTGAGEEEAFRRLRNFSMNQRLPLIEAARKVLAGESF